MVMEGLGREGAYILSSTGDHHQTWTRARKKTGSDFEEPSEVSQMFNYLDLGGGPMSCIHVLEVHQTVYTEGLNIPRNSKRMADDGGQLSHYGSATLQVSKGRKLDRSMWSWRQVYALIFNLI